MDAVFPIGKRQAEGGCEVGGIQSGVSWPWGWQRVVGSGDGMKGGRGGFEGFTGFDCFADNKAGVVTPIGFAAGDEMVGAKGEGFFAFALALTHQMGGDVSEQGSAGGGAELVGNDVQSIALGGKTQHGFGEVGTMRANDPTGSQDQVLGAALLQSQLTIALGFTISALRIGWVALGVVALFGAVKNVVG